MIIRVEFDIQDLDLMTKIVAGAMGRGMLYGVTGAPDRAPRAKLLRAVREYLAAYGVPEDFPEDWEAGDQDDRKARAYAARIMYCRCQVRLWDGEPRFPC